MKLAIECVAVSWLDYNKDVYNSLVSIANFPIYDNCDVGDFFLYTHLNCIGCLAGDWRWTLVITSDSPAGGGNEKESIEPWKQRRIRKCEESDHAA